TFAVDEKRVFVGSLNFDPRSTIFNTGLGFIIESPRMAREIEVAFNKDIPDTAYEVKLSESGSVYWIEKRDGQSIRHDTEPESGVMKRSIVWVLSKLPIERMLYRLSAPGSGCTLIGRGPLLVLEAPHVLWHKAQQRTVREANIDAFAGNGFNHPGAMTADGDAIARFKAGSRNLG